MSRQRASRSVSGRRWTRHREYVEVKTPFSRSGYETIYVPGRAGDSLGRRMVKGKASAAGRRARSRRGRSTVGTWWKKR